MDLVLQEEAKPLGAPELNKMLGDTSKVTKIIQYKELHRIARIEDLFQGGIQQVFILLQIQGPNSPKVGHWVALLDYGNAIEHFDPYGLSILQETSITHSDNKLWNLLKHGNKKFLESRRRFQKIREHVNTCGRWCVVRAKHRDMNRNQFSNYIDTLHHEPDVAVTLMTMHR